MVQAVLGHAGWIYVVLAAFITALYPACRWFAARARHYWSASAA